ncbi:hypothetical protein M441DRAFT_363380 [Trichoderma asperellum CBS 433.97]|uniref:Uncharacterized protein n=1 Tax=Trichoderma asperellum (strain ATCC 204424 / CBS 433.97 / NBRC 101777) TaxID=1042311 RepID=A0A2T3ZDY8_TRIA4|nr:hypothetical protein M441DRAFT_363380 [Trichoderma asperellum CBS 433.97]PTB43019.1 hypothetical protein M441DRAFT_363380 [Trichoderma asperellum CBS 433.97]
MPFAKLQHELAFVAKAARDSAKRAVFAAAIETRPQRDIHATLVLRLFSRLGLRLCPSSASPLMELSVLQLPGRTRTCSGGNDCYSRQHSYSQGLRMAQVLVFPSYYALFHLSADGKDYDPPACLRIGRHGLALLPRQAKQTLLTSIGSVHMDNE